ncbi:hypothetical protein [Actinomadura citrea]|uniref:Uncharacterized protein n=1 Tax=Actinomadura citrea TaxID=46158 RepID=A0A7Y9G689_9ACTN|nr:hypothetical protein [Actinomadura citrea]NYE10755.1 hypothetical protein [Actinomadura citrea]
MGLLLVYIALRGPKNTAPAATPDEAEHTETVAAQWPYERPLSSRSRRPCPDRSLIRDRDGKFPDLFDVVLADAGIQTASTNMLL